MKKLDLKVLNAGAVTPLPRKQMKNIRGGVGSIAVPVCFRCCPDDPCSPIRHYCLDVICPQVSTS